MPGMLFVTFVAHGTGIHQVLMSFAMPIPGAPLAGMTRLSCLTRPPEEYSFEP
jgi:hypothetical protein